MPGMDGIEATRRLPRQRVLILTTFGLDEYIIDALRAGASGFLLKDAPTARGRRTPCARSPPATPCSRPRSRASCSTRSARRLPAAVSRTPDELAAAHRARAAGAADARRRPDQRRDRRGARPLRGRRSRPTSRTCSASSACATACRPSSTPTRPASSPRQSDYWWGGGGPRPLPSAGSFTAPSAAGAPELSRFAIGFDARDRARLHELWDEVDRLRAVVARAR